MAKHSISSFSDIGIKRQRNEDSLLHMELDIGTIDNQHTEVTIMLLCDGMGGLNAGAWASQTACKVVLNTVEKRQYASIDDLINKLRSSVVEINDIILQGGQKASEKIGTTFTLFIMHDGIGHIIHLGDSRIYEIDPTKQAPQPQIAVLTEDQSVVMRDVRKGVITIEQAQQAKNNNILYMCLGVFPSDKLDIFETTFRVGENASYLICSDGFWHLVQEGQFIAMATGQLQIQTMINEIKATGKEQDNISAMIYKPFRQ